MNKIIKSLAGLIVVVILSACATPTIGDHLQVTHVNLPPNGPNTVTRLTRVGGGGLDWARRVICDVDDECTLFGYTIKSFGETTDFLAVHLSATEIPTWARTYGGTNKDELWDVIQTKDHGYLLVGMSQSLFFTPLKAISPHRPPRPFILKLDHDGNMQWAKTLDMGLLESGAFLGAATQDSDGNYILVGSFFVQQASGSQKTQELQQWLWQGKGPNRNILEEKDILVLKLAPDGHPLLLNRYVPDESSSMAYAVTGMPDGHVLIAGAEGRASILLEIDSNGVPVHAEGFELGMQQAPDFILRRPSGGVILGGDARGDANSSKTFSLWLDEKEAVLKARLYSNPKGLESMSAVLGPHDTLCIAGRSGDVKTDKEAGVAFIVEDSGKIKSSVVLAGSGNTEFTAIRPLTGGGYRLLGDTDGFDASYVDMVTAVWASNANTEYPISESPYTPKVTSPKINFLTGDLKSLTNIPVSLVDTMIIKVGDH